MTFLPLWITKLDVTKLLTFRPLDHVSFMQNSVIVLTNLECIDHSIWRRDAHNYEQPCILRRN